MEEIYQEINEEIQDSIDSLKRHIEAQRIKRKTLKGAKIDESLTYAIGMEVGLACLQNLQDKVKEKLKNK
jgi:hypothetical protein